jgi:hypothetical protein
MNTKGNDDFSQVAPRPHRRAIVNVLFGGAGSCSPLSTAEPTCIAMSDDDDDFRDLLAGDDPDPWFRTF